MPVEADVVHHVAAPKLRRSAAAREARGQLQPGYTRW